MRTCRIAIEMLFAVLLMGDAYAETEPAEITIYIRGEHRGVAVALLDAVDEGTPMTGVADFDSLSATYGLMGIYRKSRSSSGFYGYRFRLTFPPDVDVAVIAGAYWNLPYIQSVEPKPPGRGFDDFNVDDHTVHRPTKTPSQRSTDQETTRMTRQIIGKLIMGDFSHSVSSARDSTQIDSGYAKASDQDSGRGKRIAGQLIVGTFIAVVIFYMFSGFFFGVPGLIWVILVPLMSAL